MVQIEVGEVSVRIERSRSALGTRLGEASDGSRDWLGLGSIDPGRLVILVAPDQPTFAKWTRGMVPEWSAGVAWPDRRLIVLRLDAGDPFQVLRHEMAHVAFHRQVAGRVPRWFDEGYAVLAAGEYGRMAELRLNLAVASGRVPSLRELDGALRGEASGADEAYALAGSAVAAIARLHPSGTIDPFVKALTNGASFEGAMAAQGLTLEQYETNWHRLLKRQYNLGIWFATGGVWLVLVVVLGAGVAWRRRLDAPRRAALDIGWTLPEDNIEMTTSTQSTQTLDQQGENH